MEIQIKIFRLLKPAVAPRRSAEASFQQLLEWTEHPDPTYQLFEDKTTQPERNVALAVMFLNKAAFRAFAPHYYQHSVIRFCDANHFKDQLLAEAIGGRLLTLRSTRTAREGPQKSITQECFHNLRFVSCVLNARSIEPKVQIVRNLMNMIETWPQLSNVYSFEVVFLLGRDYLLQRLWWDWRTSPRKPEERWSWFDDGLDKRLSELETRALESTLKGFEAVRGIRPEHTPYLWHDTEHMSITFTKPGMDTSNDKV